MRTIDIAKALLLPDKLVCCCGKVKISRIKYHNTRVIGITRVTRVKDYRTVLTCLSMHKYTWEWEVINARPGPLRLEPRSYQSQIGIRVTLQWASLHTQSVTE
jgi:hypothetical protein